MSFTAATDDALAAGDVLQMEFVLEARSGEYAYNEAHEQEPNAWTTIELLKTPQIDRGGSYLYGSATFEVDRKWEEDGVLSFSDEFDPDNPVQQGAEVRILGRVLTSEGWEEEYVFRGYIDKVEPEGRILTVTAYDKLYRLHRSVCKIGETGTRADQREGYMESDIHHTFDTATTPPNGYVTLAINDPIEPPPANSLQVDRTVHPLAWLEYEVGKFVRRSWQPGGFELWNNQGAGWEQVASGFDVYEEEGLITLSDAPVGNYELQPIADLTLRVYKMGPQGETFAGEVGALTIDQILASVLTFDKDEAGASINIGPGFAAGELALSTAFGARSYLSWDIGDGLAEAVVKKLLGSDYTPGYRLVYRPSDDKVIGISETDFATKRENVKDEPPVYDVDGIYQQRVVSLPRTLDDFWAGSVVLGREPTPTALITSSAQITDLAFNAGGWIRLDGNLVPFKAYDDEGQLLDLVQSDPHNQIPDKGGYGVRDDTGHGEDYPQPATDWLEIDLTQDNLNARISKVNLMMCHLDGHEQLPLRLLGRPEGGNYRPISTEGNDFIMRKMERKSIEVNLLQYFRYLKIVAFPEDLFGAGRNEGVMVLGELQVYGVEEFIEVARIHDNALGDDRSYYPALCRKYFALGVPMQREFGKRFCRSASELQDRAQWLVWSGVRNPLRVLIESDQPDPRWLLYQTCPVSDVYNLDDTIAVLIEGQSFGPRGTQLEASDRYTDPPVE